MQIIITRALDMCLERITALTGDDPDSETLRVHCYATEVLKEARREPAADGSPLRRATLYLESATDADLNALSRHHTLDLATTLDDWKTRAEMRMMEFERTGPEKSGTG